MDSLSDSVQFSSRAHSTGWLKQKRVLRITGPWDEYREGLDSEQSPEHFKGPRNRVVLIC